AQVMGKLEVVMAGAGSGKTFDICSAIAERIAGGLDPAKIIATTYTRSAAAELKGRVQSAILAYPGLSPKVRLEKADRLELCAIGTVHAVCYSILLRYAIRRGCSPRLRVIEEEGQERCLRDLLGRLD